MDQGVLVLGEVEAGGLASVSRELLGSGRRLADELGEGLSLLLIGDGPAAAVTEASKLGADTVYLAEGAHLAAYSGDIYTELVCRITGDVAPSILLMGHTTAGREIAPRVAARLGASLSTDCVDLALDAASRRLVATRPVYGGNAMARIISKASPQMATVRPKSMPEPPASSGREARVVSVASDGVASRVYLAEVVVEEITGLKVEDAVVVVAGGAGVCQADFDLVRNLADALGGAMGGTRLPCEEGWVPSSSQIGQTGKMIAPDLYIAVGISGAPQHMAGCTGAKMIVAVNNDAEAHIFKVADYGIVADYKEALPVLIQKIRGLKGA